MSPLSTGKTINIAERCSHDHYVDVLKTEAFDNNFPENSKVSVIALLQNLASQDKTRLLRVIEHRKKFYLSSIFTTHDYDKLPEGS